MTHCLCREGIGREKRFNGNFRKRDIERCPEDRRRAQKGQAAAFNREIHSRRTMAVIRQNIASSLAVKAHFVILAGFGLATLWGAIAADVGASLLVVANALRLLRPANLKLLRDDEDCHYLLSRRRAFAFSGLLGLLLQAPSARFAALLGLQAEEDGCRENSGGR